MNRLIAALAAALFLAACGDDDGGGAAAPQPTAPLDPGLGGTWSGTSTVTVPGLAPISFATQLAIAVSGQNATVSGICPDGSGSVVAQGSGRSAQWQGSFACPAAAFDACSAVTLTHQSATLTLESGGTLTVTGSGTASGCNLTLPLTLTFSGTK